MKLICFVFFFCHSSFRVREALPRGELLLLGREGHLAEAGHLYAAALWRHGDTGDGGGHRTRGGEGPAEFTGGGANTGRRATRCVLGEGHGSFAEKTRGLDLLHVDI